MLYDEIKIVKQGDNYKLLFKYNKSTIAIADDPVYVKDFLVNLKLKRKHEISKKRYSEDRTIITVKQDDLQIKYAKESHQYIKELLQLPEYKDIKNKVNINPKLIKLLATGATFCLITAGIVSVIESNNEKAEDVIASVPMEKHFISENIEIKHEKDIFDNIEFMNNEETQINDEIKEETKEVVYAEELEVKEDTDIVSIQTGTAYTPYIELVVNNFLETADGQTYKRVCNNYGVDYNLLIPLIINETSLDHYATIEGGERFNGSAYGLMQIEDENIDREVTCTNPVTNESESILITKEGVMDLETNVQIGVMMFVKTLDKYNDNRVMAINSHNTGEGAIDAAILLYSKEKGITIEDVKNNYSDLGWIKYIDYMNTNSENFNLLYKDLDLTESEYNQLAKLDSYFKDFREEYNTKNYGTKGYVKNYLDLLPEGRLDEYFSTKAY